MRMLAKMLQVGRIIDEELMKAEDLIVSRNLMSLFKRLRVQQDMAVKSMVHTPMH